VKKSLAVLVALVCISGITVRAAENPESLQGIIKSLRDNQVAKVDVFGAPEIIESNEAIRADVLATVAKHRFSFSPGSSSWRTRFLVYALQGARPVVDKINGPSRQIPVKGGDTVATIMNKVKQDCGLPLQLRLMTKNAIRQTEAKLASPCDDAEFMGLTVSPGDFIVIAARQ